MSNKESDILIIIGEEKQLEKIDSLEKMFEYFEGDLLGLLSTFPGGPNAGWAPFLTGTEVYCFQAMFK